MSPSRCRNESSEGTAARQRVWGLAFATVFIMSLYTLWTNWTTIYFVHDWNMTQEEANAHFAWIPPCSAWWEGFSAAGWPSAPIRGGDGSGARADESFLAQRRAAAGNGGDSV